MLSSTGMEIFTFRSENNDDITFLHYTRVILLHASFIFLQSTVFKYLRCIEKATKITVLLGEMFLQKNPHQVSCYLRLLQLCTTY